MAIIPLFRLYASNGSSLLYTFPYVSYCNIPEDSSNKSIVISNIRSKGSLVIEGSTDSFELIVEGTIVSTDYDALVVAKDALVTAIARNTPYVLKKQKTSSTDYSYNVKRIDKIEWLDTNRERTYQKYRAKFIANSW